MHVSFSVDLASSLGLCACVDPAWKTQRGPGYEWQCKENLPLLFLLFKKGLHIFGEDWSPLRGDGWNTEIHDLFILMDFKTIRGHEPDL